MDINKINTTGRTGTGWSKGGIPWNVHTTLSNHVTTTIKAGVEGWPGTSLVRGCSVWRPQKGALKD